MNEFKCNKSSNVLMPKPASTVDELDDLVKNPGMVSFIYHLSTILYKIVKLHICPQKLRCKIIKIH